MVDVHVLIKSQDLQSEYNATTGWIRFKDLEEAMNIKVLKYALSTSDIAPSTEDYKEAAGFKALPSHTTSLWLIAKREGVMTHCTFPMHVCAQGAISTFCLVSSTCLTGVSGVPGDQPWFLKLLKPDFS